MGQQFDNITLMLLRKFSRASLALVLGLLANNLLGDSLEVVSNTPTASIAVTAGRVNDIFASYTSRIRVLAAEKKNSQVFELVNEVARIPKEQLVGYERETCSIFLTGQESAVALNDYESAIRFIKLQLELETAAEKGKHGDAGTTIFRKKAVILCRRLLGQLLFQNGQHDEAISVLTTAANEATQLGLVDLVNEINVWLGCAQIGNNQIQKGIATLTGTIDQLEAGSSPQLLGFINLTHAYDLIGEYVEAERVSARMLEVSIKASKIGLAVSSLRFKGDDFRSAGRLVEARECLEYALRASESVPDKFQNDIFFTFASLARVYCQLLEVVKASQALENAWRTLPEAASQYSLTESNLLVAGLCSIESEYNEKTLKPELQLRWALRSHSIYLQFAKGNPLVMAESCLRVGGAYCNNHNFSEALAWLASAKQEAEKLAHPNFELSAGILSQLATVLSDQNDAENAIKVRSELLNLVAQKYGKTDSRYFEALVGQAADFLQEKNFEKASELCVESQSLFNEHAWRDLAFLPAGRSAGRASFSKVVPIVCSAGLFTTNETARKNAAYVSMISKGLETELWSAQAQLSINQSIGAVRDSIAEYWSDFGRKAGGEDASKAYKLRGEISVTLQTMLEESKFSFNAIQKAIPADAVLMDFTSYWRFDPTAKSDRFKEDRYAVYLTFPANGSQINPPVEIVDLGKVVPINEAVELVCKRMSAGQFAAKDLVPALQRLSDLVYAPLAAYLTNVSHLIVCPDGQLSRLPFEALPCGQNGNKFLIEEKTISYVTSGREIVRIASPKSSVHSSKSLIMGNPDFNFDLGSSRGNEALKSSSQPENQSLLTSAATRSLSRDYRGLKFDPLPGSGVEATNVAGLLGTNATLRLGADAREAELKAVVSPRVLHLATHGFYLPDQEFKQTNSLAWSSAFTRPGSPKAGTPNDWENPLVRCGIALAGANHALQITNAIAEDGLLTGLEASLLNLQGTELVILSACDSGTGEVKIGEGVMSLRRAFRIAGAESVLASHWPVNDKATSRLMTEFMRRWHSGEPRAQAWREAQLSLLRSKDLSNPYFWAAFTLTGQWN